MKIKYLGFFFLLFASAPLQAAVITQTVTYRDGGVELEGYLAYDDSIQGKRPAVIVVHEWKGLNEYTQERARQLASLGYVGFAADIYGKGVRPSSHEEAAQVAGIYRGDRQLLRSRAQAALDYVRQLPETDPSRIAAIGYCFGGTTVLEMARAGMDVKGVASFHGALDTPMPAAKGSVKAKVVIFHGDEDSFVKPEALEGVKREMREAGADWQVIVFGGAVHSFTVPSAGSDKSRGMAYSPEADKRSWGMLESFLKEIFA